MALTRACESIRNCEHHPEGHVIDCHGYLPSDYAIAHGASADVVDELFRFEARVLPDHAGASQSALDVERRRKFATREPERRRRRQMEPGGSRSTKRPCVR